MVTDGNRRLPMAAIGYQWFHELPSVKIVSERFSVEIGNLYGKKKHLERTDWNSMWKGQIIEKFWEKISLHK